MMAEIYIGNASSLPGEADSLGVASFVGCDKQSITYNKEKSEGVPHLLEIVREIRERIYDFINDDIQSTRLVAWNRNIQTQYEGLRLACRKLYTETYHRIFHYAVTGQQHVRLFRIPLNRQIFQDLRMLSIEIDHNADCTIYAGFCEALQCLQLTIQELHILFTGKDRDGIQTAIHGCGNLTGWNNPCQSFQGPLSLQGQPVESKRFALYRQLSLMRQLRILRVRNANIPLLQSMVLVNKPNLDALSVVCDPRTFLHMYARVPRQMLKGLMMVAKDVPSIKVLELTANAVVPASGVVFKVAQGLEHLTWIIPPFDHQRQAGFSLPYDFYEELGYLMHALAWRAYHLTTLRLCISMRETSGLSNLQTDRDLDVMAANFRRYLPQFQKLEHLEIHYSGGQGFFRHNLIASLPSSLKRLYITDNTISPLELQQQIWQRYFRPLSGRLEIDDGIAGTPDYGTNYDRRDNIISKTSRDYSMNDKIMIAVDEHGWPYYHAGADGDQNSTSPGMLVCYRNLREDDDNSYLAETDQFVGEQRLRADATSFDNALTGRLGFITYEYDGNEKDDHEISVFEDGDTVSDTAIIVRLSGKLLDRERHLHFKYKPSLEVTEGIPPRVVSAEIDNGSQPQTRNLLAETAQYSSHLDIQLAIYNVNESAPKEVRVNENNETLSACLGQHWYFGTENEAMKVFEGEIPAEAGSQRLRSMLDIVDYTCDKKCRWMSPDHRISPVGSFAEPVISRSWQSRAHK